MELGLSQLLVLRRDELDLVKYARDHLQLGFNSRPHQILLDRLLDLLMLLSYQLDLALYG